MESKFNMLKKAPRLIFISLFFSQVLAQEKIEKNTFIQEANSNTKNGKTLESKGIHLPSITLNPVLSIGEEKYPNEEMNFSPENDLNSIGDVNKDGFQDYYYSVIAGNESTSKLSDRINKTILLYGSENGLTKENSAYFVDSTSIFKDGMVFVGDLTGDDITEGFIYDDSTITVYTDISGGSLKNIESRKLITEDFFYDFEVKSFGDFNYDGFDDAIFFPRTVNESESAKFYLIYGAETISEIKVSTIDNNKVIDAIGRFEQLFYTDFDKDSTSEIVQFTGLRSQDVNRIFIYELWNNDSLVVIDTLASSDFLGRSLDVRSGKLAGIDLDNNGFKELIVGARSFTYIFSEDTSSANILKFDEALQGGDYVIIGDYINDGNIEILTDANYLRLEQGFSFFENFESGNVSFINTLRTDSKVAGDLSGDGIDDILLEFSEGDFYGYKIFHGDISGNFSDTSSLSYKKPFVPNDYVKHTFNAGDLNGDEIDDYGFVYNGVQSSIEFSARLEIFFGGDLGKMSPDLVISHPDNHQISMPSSGDFNGDGFSDIAINFRNENSGLNIYYGGNNMDNESDYELVYSQLFPEQLQRQYSNDAFEALNNAGDINNDGNDDLVFSTYQVRQKTFLLFGGDSFSANPDLEIDYFATSFTSMKDFNGDGINDLALSLWNDNKIKIYAGFNSKEGKSFSQEPIIEIVESANDGMNVLTYMGINVASGDYNGDGFSDLVASSFFHLKTMNRDEGIEGNYIYLGGTNADSLVDHKFGLKTELFKGTSNTQQVSEFLTSNLGELTTVPDQNEDGTDEILIGTIPQNFGADSKTNAVIYYGNSEITNINENGDVLFKAPNSLIGLGGNVNNVVSQNAKSAIGDFDGDLKNDFLFTQERDFNFVKSPVYMYTSDQFTVSNEESVEIVDQYKLSQNYPNPFNPTTNINYSIPQSAEVTMKIYDVTGRLVSTLVKERQTAGSYTINLNASAWASGIYFYRITAGDFVQTKKLTLIK